MGNSVPPGGCEPRGPLKGLREVQEGSTESHPRRQPCTPHSDILSPQRLSLLITTLIPLYSHCLSLVFLSCWPVGFWKVEGMSLCSLWSQYRAPGTQ